MKNHIDPCWHELFKDDPFLPNIRHLLTKNKRSISTGDASFHKGDGRNVHVQTKGCMFVCDLFHIYTLARIHSYINVSRLYSQSCHIVSGYNENFIFLCIKWEVNGDEYKS